MNNGTLLVVSPMLTEFKPLIICIERIAGLKKVPVRILKSFSEIENTEPSYKIIYMTSKNAYEALDVKTRFPNNSVFILTALDNFDARQQLLDAGVILLHKDFTKISSITSNIIENY